MYKAMAWLSLRYALIERAPHLEVEPGAALLPSPKLVQSVYLGYLIDVNSLKDKRLYRYHSAIR